MAPGVSPSVRVMLVEDNAAVRRAVAALLNASPDLEVCAEAGTVAEAGPLAEVSRPDVVIVDLRLPDGSGVEAGREVRSSAAGVRVLLLTSASEEEALVASMLAGASAFLVKQLVGHGLVDTVRAVAGGEMLLDLTAGAAALERLDPSADVDRDASILSLVAEGRTNRQISQDLGLDEALVRERLASIAGRLGGRRRPRPQAFRGLPWTFAG
jgi:DNA-binding NarL/FixJ family response regulator